MAEPDVATLIADLKITVVQGHIRQIIEHSQVMAQLSTVPDTLAHLKKQVDDIHEEVSKAVSTEFLEGMGLDGFAAALEKLWEGKNIVPYVVSALLGLLVPAIGVYLAGKLNQISRDIQQVRNPDRQILATDENGDIRPQNRDDVERRERRIANGGTSLADIPETANFDNLRNQLTTLNPHLEKFNDLAPAFIREFRKLPSESKATKAASGVKKIAEAVAQVEPTTMQPVATGIGKIKDAVATADPRKITKVAQAVGKLQTAMDGFEPNRLPDATRIQSSADAMKNLTRETGNLRTKLREFASTVQTLDQAIGTATA
ncbi:hypothetical protein ABZ958_30945 [Streptomyces sp. NPDC046237]|uniref:hypothetical protein n=1 Tax=Streptomyces sp. NPDC046237 TaxID=3154914 RepID=UPI0033D3FF38